MPKPVIIAGAGPAGSVLALSLAKANIDVILLEKFDSLPIDLRASTFHPPSLELLEGLGVIQPMLDKGLIVDRYQYRDRKTGEVAEFNMKAISDITRHPYRLQLEQYELTHIIYDELKQYPNVKVLFGHKLIGFEQDNNQVQVDVEYEGQAKRLVGSYLLGCDGASSNVRKSAGIDYEGFTYDENFLVVSTSFPFEEVFENLSYVNYVSDPDQWCVILRTDKLWRVLWPTDPNEKNLDKYLEADFIQAQLQKLHPKEGDYDIGHKTLYKVHQRVAKDYYQGRMVLVGDACHINNPLGGMGMNGGLHDAFNLADKLIRIINDGEDHAALFAHYQRQRKDLAVQFVQKHTIENKKLMEANDPDVQRKRQAMFMATAADPVKAKAFIRERAMIDCLNESEAVQ
ncbi:NAD(P)/FAD-dependent oxidoreductase [Paraferrimonas sp. SM1919]|uniref:FAD-dependent oxidoreductase n=1 Tax=Paraferrimonas sp. SM1919 TaxID=2662263 RepID=UPI0013D530E4|nr:NAD(P)/FAD-dependent oxidoreductase [Paraferrimonas sp. SM1919]